MAQTRLMLSSKRLVLKPLTLEDTSLFLDMNQTAFVRKYLWDDQVINEDTAIEILQENERLMQESRYGLWKILLADDLSFVGYVGLWFFFDESQPQLLYALAENFSGKGYAGEASQRIIDYCFQELDFTYLTAATDEVHVASQRVAQKLGMKKIESRIEDGKPTVFFRIDKKA